MRLYTSWVWTLAGLALASAVLAQDGGGRVVLERIETSQIATYDESGEQAPTAEMAHRSVSADSFPCPPLEKRGALVVVFEGIAFIVASHPIPMEPATRLAEHYAMHTPKGAVLYSAYFHVTGDSLYWSTVRATSVPDGCVVLSGWASVVRYLKLKEKVDGRATT